MDWHYRTLAGSTINLAPLGHVIRFCLRQYGHSTSTSTLSDSVGHGTGRITLNGFMQLTQVMIFSMITLLSYASPLLGGLSIKRLAGTERVLRDSLSTFLRMLPQDTLDVGL